MFDNMLEKELKTVCTVFTVIHIQDGMLEKNISFAKSKLAEEYFVKLVLLHFPVMACEELMEVMLREKMVFDEPTNQAFYIVEQPIYSLVTKVADPTKGELRHLRALSSDEE
jgi:hypothetical protein